MGRGGAPLAGVRVLDLSRYIAGPFCALLLADLGADVVKVERPEGEEARALSPRVGGLSTYFLVYNRNKKGITLNLRHPRGPELLRRLAAAADVLVENFRPGVMAALGCDYARLRAVNPRLVMVSVSGFGQEGPSASLPAYDAIAQAAGGLMSLTGWPGGPPLLAGTFVGDYAAALYAAAGAVAALFERERTGRGAHVEVALVDSVASLLMTAVPDYLLDGREMGPVGTHDRYRSPAGAYRTRDGSVYLMAVTPRQFAALAHALGRPDLLEDPRFRDPDERVRHRADLDAVIARWTEAHSTDEVVALLRAASVPCARVATVADVARDPVLRARGQILPVEFPDGELTDVPGCPVRFEGGAPGPARPAPRLGEHTVEVYKEWLGLSREEIESLVQEEVL
jgi:crotonobetainyl-CoA:carnitine CoA-transferase CaiB-like acyl-CoA transferase